MKHIKYMLVLKTLRINHNLGANVLVVGIVLSFFRDDAQYHVLINRQEDILSTVTSALNIKNLIKLLLDIIGKNCLFKKSYKKKKVLIFSLTNFQQCHVKQCKFKVEILEQMRNSMHQNASHISKLCWVKEETLSSATVVNKMTGINGVNDYISMKHKAL